jgi:hypothetical protein
LARPAAVTRSGERQRDGTVGEFARADTGEGSPPPTGPKIPNDSIIADTLRKAVKTKGHFPSEDAARKLLYLAILNAVPAWRRTRNWATALLAFKIHFGDRLPN